MPRALAPALAPVLALLATAALAQEPQLELRAGDVVCLVGNALAERMQHDGWLEARLQVRFPELGLAVRNLGFGGDALVAHQRTMNFGKTSADPLELDLPDEPFVPWDRYLDHCDASVVLAFFGANEALEGVAPAEMRARVARFVEHVRAQRYDESAPPRLVLCGPIPFEDLGSPSLPDGREENRRIRATHAAMAEAAAAADVPYVDLFEPMLDAYEAHDVPLTIDGLHLTALGNAALAAIVERALFGTELGAAAHERMTAVRAAVLEKNALWFDRYRATDGYNVYGGRSRQVYEGAGTDRRFSNFEVLQRELDHLDVLVANRDRAIGALARAQPYAIDDSNAPPLLAVLTNKPGSGEGGAHAFVGGEEALEHMRVAPGMRVELFADERAFPELVNPVQMSFDARGRLWVAVWPTYPHWTPGTPKDDKLLVLEDTDGDGRADVCTTFADGLHNPTGFEHWNGGVLLAAAPDLLFLDDTDGDGRADRTERLLHGLSSADTHHAANSFVLGPDGALYFQEGTFHRSQVETPYGVVRNRDACVWRFEPRTFRVERYVAYDFANPHGHVFDRWGQDFVTDGTGNVNYWAAPFSGRLEHPAKHAPYFPFFQQRSRPAAATELLSSSHFPPQSQGNYLVANVIGFQGIFQYELDDDGSGFGAVETTPILESADPSFRPVDIEVGPDGALYLLDWHNPLIGHLQHHLRDPARDAAHGRVYRVTCEGRALLEPQPIAGEPIERLLELLRSPDDRLRYRARIELSARDTGDVVRAARAWASALDEDDPEHEHHLLEALWLHQQHDRIDRALLVRLLAADDPRARAAATRVLRHGRRHLADALELLAPMARDPHPRVRLEAVVAASFFDSARAATVALAALEHPTDRFLDYALAETMRALEPRWREALRAGELVFGDDPAVVAFLLERAGGDELARLPRTASVLHALLARHGADAAERAQVASELAALRGTAPALELAQAIRRVDAAGGAHADHVLHELAAALRSAGAAPRDELVALAERGARATTRSIGYAAWIEHDGSADGAWESAARSAEGLVALLGAVELLPSERRAALHDRIRPLMFAPPAGLAAGGPGSGLEVAFYEPAPADGRRETLDALAPATTLVAPAFTLDLAPANASDSYGLAFRGTLHVPRAGRYTFTTASDDGSRLYVAERCVVDNDGAHVLRARSGSIELAAGAHPILVTYHEQGGGHGLEVLWEGPGLERAPIPASALGRGDAGALRAAAIRAMAHVPARGEQRIADATLLLGDGAAFAAAVELLRAVPRDAVPRERIRAAVETLGAVVAGLPAEERTSPAAIAALAVGRALAADLPADDAAPLLATLDGLGGTVVLVRTLPHQMLYDLGEILVEAGRPVSIVFQNNDVMPHNLVVARPGTLAAVGERAERERVLVPDGGDVLWHTRLLNPGESERLSFVAPSTPGDHPYLCTYPGHWRVMNGVLRVVASLDGVAPLERRAPREDAAAARAFVRNWTFDELAPRFADGWRHGRSLERGRVLFDEAGCIRCHATDGEGAIAGPALSALRPELRGAELLRHVLEPSLEVQGDYAFHGLELDDGTTVVGRIVAEDDADLHVVERLLAPGDVTLVAKDAVVARWDTELSPMPSGLLVTLSEEEILDLVAFLEAPRDEPWVTYAGGGGPGAGRHVVLVAGDDEYRSEEALPVLARILARHHGFRCTVLFPIDPATGAITPDFQTNVPGLHQLDDADLMVCFLRFRELPDEDMAHFARYVESGNPLVGLRTATHAFRYEREPDSAYRRYGWRSDEWPGGFGRRFLGETWVAHHGHHDSESTRALVEPGREDHPILRGVDDAWGPTDVYAVGTLPPDALVLLRGQVLAGMRPDSLPVADGLNEPMMPLVWVRELGAEGQRVVCSTIGAAVDLESEGLRRVLVNACYWALGLEGEIPAHSRVDVVGDFEPTPFGFGTYVKGRRPTDWALE